MGMWGGHVDDEGAEVEGDQQGNKGGEVGVQRDRWSC